MAQTAEQRGIEENEQTESGGTTRDAAPQERDPRSKSEVTDERQAEARERAAMATPRTSVQAGEARAGARTRSATAGAVDAPDLAEDDRGETRSSTHATGNVTVAGGGVGENTGSSSRQTGNRGGGKRN